MIPPAPVSAPAPVIRPAPAVAPAPAPQAPSSPIPPPAPTSSVGGAGAPSGGSQTFADDDFSEEALRARFAALIKHN
jgi:hypothetical protein